MKQKSEFRWKHFYFTFQYINSTKLLFGDMHFMLNSLKESYVMNTFKCHLFSGGKKFLYKETFLLHHSVEMNSNHCGKNYIQVKHSNQNHLSWAGMMNGDSRG